MGGRGLGLILSRTYSAQAGNAAKLGAFGYGWSGSYSDYLTIEESGKEVTLTAGDGSTVPFTEASKGVYAAADWNQDLLTGSTEAGFTLTTPDQTKCEFSGDRQARKADHPTATKRRSATPKPANSESHRPGRPQITLAYNGEGLLEARKTQWGTWSNTPTKAKT